jgi:hypothetical protein
MTVFNSFLDELRLENPDCVSPGLIRLLHDIETADCDIALDLFEMTRRILSGSGTATERLAVFDLLIKEKNAQLDRHKH